MTDKETLPHNLGLDLVRATEAAALAAGRWLGLGQPEEADRAASRAMAGALHDVEMDGRLCLGDEARQGSEAAFMTGQRFGTGLGPEVDVLARSAASACWPRRIQRSRQWPSPRGIFAPGGRYMEKIMVNGDVAALVPECLGAPATWTLALVARAKHKRGVWSCSSWTPPRRPGGGDSHGKQPRAAASRRRISGPRSPACGTAASTCSPERRRAAG